MTPNQFNEIEPLKDGNGRTVASLGVFETNMVFIDGGRRDRTEAIALHNWLTRLLYGGPPP